MVTKKKKTNTKPKPSYHKRKPMSKNKPKPVAPVVPNDELTNNKFFEQLGVETDESTITPTPVPVMLNDDNEEILDLTPWQRFVKFLKEFV